MSAPKVTRWLMVNVTEALVDSWGWSTEDVGRAWMNVFAAVTAGEDPSTHEDELTRILWRACRAKQRTGRQSLSAATRGRIFARDGELCRYCATSEGPFEVDHVDPLSRGGSDEDGNLCVACQACNRSKGAKTLAEWIGGKR